MRKPRAQSNTLRARFWGKRGAARECEKEPAVPLRFGCSACQLIDAAPYAVLRV